MVGGAHRRDRVKTETDDAFVVAALSLKPGGAQAKRAGDEFERRAADSW